MVCCANGAGSSLMMKMTLEKVLKKLGIKPGKVHHCALSEGKSSASQFNVVFCARNFKDMFADAEKKGTRVLGLKNLLSVAEMEQAMRDAGLAAGEAGNAGPAPLLFLCGVQRGGRR